MLAVISPAKTLDFDTPACTGKNSVPLFPKQTSELIKLMRCKTPKEVSKLMRISPKLAELNVQRYKNFKTSSKNGKQAALAFKGDVYLGLEAETYGERDFTFAQKHLRILSGLYGLLRPLDLIQPYRLEMGTRLATPKGESLYDYWGSAITEQLAKELGGQRNKTLVNLASKEYFTSVHKDSLPGRLITPIFKDYSNGTYKVLAFFAKRARGHMASYMVKNRIQKPEDLQGFDVDGYRFDEARSSDDDWVFVRKAH
ncbi:MAG: peroxide stress protein YaaA [Pseudomonadales bacterium]